MYMIVHFETSMLIKLCVFRSFVCIYPKTCAAAWIKPHQSCLIVSIPRGDSKTYCFLPKRYTWVFHQDHQWSSPLLACWLTSTRLWTTLLRYIHREPLEYCNSLAKCRHEQIMLFSCFSGVWLRSTFAKATVRTPCFKLDCCFDFIGDSWNVHVLSWEWVEEPTILAGLLSCCADWEEEVRSPGLE